MKAEKNQRLIFMPHSEEGVYMALVLKNSDKILQDLQESERESNPFDEIDINKLQKGDTSLSGLMKSTSSPVEKVVVKNNLFLDLSSLSKNL